MIISRVLIVLVAARLLGAGYSAQVLPATHAHLPRSDTDTVVQSIAVIGGLSMSGYLVDGAHVQRFDGNVTGVHGTTELSAAWAERFVESRQFLFVGEVMVIDEGDTLTADTVRYDESGKVGRAAGNVRLSDGVSQVFASRGGYYVDDKRADFFHGMTLADSAATITGDSGRYWTEDRRADVRGNVRYESREVDLKADSLTSLREEEVTIAHGRVRIAATAEKDSTGLTWLFGDRAQTDGQRGTRVVRGRALMIQLRQDTSGTDTLALQSNRLAMVETDTVRRMIATGGVRYWAEDLAASADSVVHKEWTVRTDSTALDGTEEADAGVILLFGAPVLWTEHVQITGDTMRVVLKDGKLDSLLVWGEVFVAHEDTVLGRINQVRGHTATAWFAEEDLRTFSVGPNAEVLLFRRTGEDTPDGALQISGDEATLTVRGDEPEVLTFGGENQGTYFPENVLRMPLELKGYRWLPEQRPTLLEFLSDARYVAGVRQEAEL